MRRILPVFLAIFGVFCLGSAAMADGFTVYLDNNHLNLNPPVFLVTDYYYLTGGVEYTAASGFLAGGMYSHCLGVEPADPNVPVHGYVLDAYGGYSLRLGRAFSLAGIGGYLAYDYRNTTQDDIFSGFALGFRCALDLDRILFSAMYLEGVGSNVTINGSDLGAADVSLVEVKGAYHFSEAFGAYLSYRRVFLGHPNLAGRYWNLQGFGLGLQYRF